LGQVQPCGHPGLGGATGRARAFQPLWPGHYLWASAAALELTLLHNFVWHLNYTWPDRRSRTRLPAQLLRFHLSNGLVSMLGNLALMKLLVEEARLPVIAANGIAIVCCSLANFCLGHTWAFAERPHRSGDAVAHSGFGRVAGANGNCLRS
jgi:putative flippase GtrA